MARQLKSRSGSTATLSGSTIIKENLTVLGSFSGATISGGTYFSGSTNLNKIFSTIVNSIGDYVNISGDTMTGKLTTPDLSATTINSTNFTGITVSATTLSATTIYSGSSNLDTLFVNKGGYRNIWIDADKMVIFSVIGNPYSGATSNILLGEGDVYSGSSVNTDNIVAKYFLFTGGTYDQNVQFKFSMPDEWDLGTIKAKIYWDTELGASINDGVVWGIKAGALSNDDSLSGETVFGTEVLITDRVIIPQDLHITSASTAITIGGTPALDDLIYFQISRKVNNTNDTLAQEARLFGTKLQYKELTTNIVQW